MKPRILAVAMLLACSSARSGGGPTIYPNDDRTWPIDYLHRDEAQDRSHMEKILAQAQGQRECFPASDFPEGNWGPVTNGCQVSIRFEKASFAPGEPVVATLLFRSLTNKTIRYIIPIDLVPPVLQVVTTDGLQLAPSIPGPWTGREDSRWVRPWTQHKRLEHLDKVFDLTNGVYFARVATRFAIEPEPPPEVLQRWAAAERLHATNMIEFHQRIISGEIKKSDFDRVGREYEDMEAKKLKALGREFDPPPLEWFEVHSADARIAIEAKSPAPQK